MKEYHSYSVVAPRCTLCDKPAITTAAQIPVCSEHHDAYHQEARQYLPAHQRPFYQRLIAASQGKP